MKITREQAERILKSRTIINTPGKYSTKVNNITLWEGRYIVNTGLMNTYLAQKAKELFMEEDYQEACNTNLSVTVFINDNGEPSGHLPKKGDIVHVMADFIETKDGDQALLLQSCHEIPVTAPVGKFSFSTKEVKEDATVEKTEATFEKQ